MVGCFGLLGDYGNPYHFPLDHLVEANPRLDVFMLHRIGVLVEGAVTRLTWGDHGGCQLVMRAPDILIEGTKVAVIWDEPMEGVSRPWLECPACRQRVRHLYLRNRIACRRCHGLDYASRHLHRQTPGIHRVVRLRRKIGADPRPFIPILQRPKSHVRFHRIAERIRAEEASLVDYLGTIVHDLRRRIRVRKSKGKW
jgi:hypothetical protein